MVFLQWSGYLHCTAQCKNLVNHLRMTPHKNLKTYHVFLLMWHFSSCKIVLHLVIWRCARMTFKAAYISSFVKGITATTWFILGGRATKLLCPSQHFSTMPFQRANSDNKFIQNRFVLTECVVNRWFFVMWVSN